MSHTDIELRRYRPEGVTYFRASDTTYYETTRREKRSRGGIVVGTLGVLGANGLLGWAAWSAHQACLHGNTHSVLAEAVVAVTAGGSAILAGKGFASHTERGSWAGTLLSPAALILAGFGVLLWAPKWPASMVTTLMDGVLNGGLAAVGMKLRREERGMNHEAGMQHDAIAGRLQENHDTQQAETERALIEQRSWFATGYDADRRADRAVYDLHLRHPEIVAAPERYARAELAAAPQHLAITTGREPADDWMAVADAIDERMEF